MKQISNHNCCQSHLQPPLKAQNVLLRSDASSERGFTAKIADFGLSVKMDTTETHVSGMNQGTTTHMAPELLMDGRQSKAADVYAFGIVLWELFTGGQPFKGIQKVVLSYKIAKDGLRPEFPPEVPEDYVSLAKHCWMESPDDRWVLLTRGGQVARWVFLIWGKVIIPCCLSSRT